MSKYTTTIQEYIQSVAISNANIPLSDIPVFIEELSEDEIHEIGKTLFPKTFPMYEETERDTFINLFIDHFYFYEIGQETISRFKWCLKDFLNTRMPYYTQIYNSKLSSLEDAIKNYDIEKEETNEGTAETTTYGKTNGTNKTSSNSSTKDNGTSKQMQFPLNADTIQEISRVVNDRDTSDESSSDEETEVISNGNSGSETNNHIIGRTQGIYGVNKLERTKEFRELVFSINELIFKDVRDNHLFMELW